MPKVIVKLANLSARQGPLRAGLSIALALCLAATLVAASSFREPGSSATSRSAAASSVPSVVAAFGANPSASATPEPTAQPRPLLPVYTPSVSALPALASCAPVAVTGCDTPPPPTPILSVTPFSGPTFALRVPILEYHRVKPPAGESGGAASLIVPPEIFTAQMDALFAAGWHTITMGELGEGLRLGAQPPPNTFVITFDDGYEDGYLYAFPILSRHGFVATYFVIAGQIGQSWQLSPAHMRELVAAGNEIGNHSWSHTNMEIMTPERLVYETYGASAVIAQCVGVWPKSFSYPMGLTYSQSTAAVAATPGILTAVIQGGSKRETWANRLGIPRIRVGPGTYPLDLVARLSRYVS
jgi:peptidoglycan/xylan/chitin deacetylase (PgdA/CDA1 family)